MKKLVLLILLIVLTLPGCDVISDKLNPRWEGFVYPNKNDLYVHINMGEYGSLEDCRDVCLAKLEELKALYKGDYECGKNCKNKAGFSVVKVCEETVR
jgi:hypothetical protein